MRRALILCLAGCSNLLGIDDLQGPPDTSMPPTGDGPVDPVVDCKAQRVVHLVGGTAGLAWFTLIWPVPGVINSFTPDFAYDNPSFATNLTTDPSHQLFVRTNGVAAVWAGKGADPQPSVFIAGQNETHSQTPSSAITVGGTGLVAAATAIQIGALNPPVPVLAFERSAPYGTAPGAPPPRVVIDVQPALDELQAEGLIDAVTAGQLNPSATQLANYFSPGAPASIVSIGTRLAFTANAFKLGLVGSVVMPAFNDDPHGAFNDVTAATARANQLAAVLDAFYADLAAANEVSCGNNGQLLSLADNVVMIVNGDTMKNPYMRAGWPDGTPQNSNLLYVRSNGFTKPGWFGELTPQGTRLFFDPATGLSGPGGDAPSNTQAAYAGALYSIARGDRTLIAPYVTNNIEFDGVVVP